MADLLIVDDEPDLAEVLAAILAAAGHTVRTARDGREGLRLVSERQPDLVLLDVESSSTGHLGRDHQSPGPISEVRSRRRPRRQAWDCG